MAAESRRGFLLGLGATLVAAPAIVRRESLDLVRGVIVPSSELWVPPGWEKTGDGWVIKLVMQRVVLDGRVHWELLPP